MRTFGVRRTGKIHSDKSTLLLEIDDVVNESPEIDLCSSSVPEGGEMGNNTGDSSDLDKSRGESVNENNNTIIIIHRNK